MSLTPEQRRLVESAVPIAWSVVRKVQSKYSWHEPDDLFQEAMLGVIAAVKRFNPEIATFCTFIHARIGFAISDFVRDSFWGPRRETNRIPVVSLDETNKNGDARQIPSATTTTDVEPWLDMEMAALDMPWRDWVIYQELKREAPIWKIANSIGKSPSLACYEVKRFRQDYRWAVEAVA